MGSRRKQRGDVVIHRVNCLVCEGSDGHQQKQGPQQQRDQDSRELRLNESRESGNQGKEEQKHCLL